VFVLGAIMPLKARTVSQNVQLQQARSALNSAVTLSDLQTLLAETEYRLKEVEAVLLVERENSARLSKALDDEVQRTARLQKALNIEKACSAKHYQALRVERRGRQRGQARKVILEEQIKFLCSADIKKSDDLKRITSNASKAIDSLIRLEKQNSTLKSELLQCLERCRAEEARSQELLCQTNKKAKESQMLAAKLQKRCDRDNAKREKAIGRAREKAIKQRSVHSLLHKGVYTEETRHLIRLLVQAGCSREYVSQVIHAIFETAGISVIGHISRRTVSRAIVEGYYAAQVQLGYEMKAANSMFI
jgi:hypothetical protein